MSSPDATLRLDRQAARHRDRTKLYITATPDSLGLQGSGNRQPTAVCRMKHHGFSWLDVASHLQPTEAGRFRAGQMSRSDASDSRPSCYADSKSGGNQKPPVSIKKSITSQHIICLECGKKQKMLKHHLCSAHGLTPDEYRTKWQLPSTYPMIARACAQRRATRSKKVALHRRSSV